MDERPIESYDEASARMASALGERAQGSIEGRGARSASEAEEIAAVQATKRRLKEDARQASAFADEFRERTGISFRAEPPDSVLFRYGANGEVIVNVRPKHADTPAAPEEEDVCPFDVSIESGGAVIIATGTVNGIVPAGLSGLVAPSSGVRYLILNLTLAGGVATSATFTLEVSLPAPFTAAQGTPPTLVRIFTHRIEDREPTRIISCGSLWATPVELFRTDKPSPIPAGERPFISWYGYEVKAA